MLETVNECSKHVHGREYTIVSDLDKQDLFAAETITSVGAFLDAIHFCRRAVLDPIVDELDKTAVDTLLSAVLQEVDELATHWSLQDLSVDDTVVHKIGPTTITYRSTGSLDVILQFGSNSDVRNDMGAELPQTFPFVCDIEVPQEDPWDLGLAETFPSVDVSEWADAMRPDDWDGR